MKKNLGFLFIFLVLFILFGSCNNATRDPDSAQKKQDTVHLQRDSILVKDTSIKH
jgi:hypothetical protein